MKQKILMWCVRVEPGETWFDWDEFASQYPQKGNTDPPLVDCVWYDFGFDTRKERNEFVRAIYSKYPNMGSYGQIRLYKEVDG